MLQIGLQRWTFFKFLAQRGGGSSDPPPNPQPLCVHMCMYISGLKELKGAAMHVCGDLITLLHCAAIQPAATFYHYHMLRDVVTTVIHLYWRWQVKMSTLAADLPRNIVLGCCAVPMSRHRLCYIISM